MNPNKRKHSGKLEINDLLDDAVANAIARRGFSQDLSDEEAAMVGGGKLAVSEIAIDDIAIAGFKPIYPLPTKPICWPIDPVCYPIEPCPPKPCEPIIAGLIYIPPGGDVAELA
jgi:hypothetical protein